MSAQIIDKISLSATTTDGTTAVTMATYAIPSGASAMVSITIVGRDGSGNTVICRQTTPAKNVAGTSSLVGSVTSTVGMNGDVALVTAATSYSVSGGNLLIKVTGVAATTITWWGQAEIIIN